MTRRGPTDRLLAAAAVYAAAEVAAGLLIGRFFAWGRAEALLFLAFRPWLLLAAALTVARLDWRRRLAFYLLALTAAAAGESLFLARLGGNPWIEALRGWGGGLALALALDLLLQLGRRLGGRTGLAAATGLAGLLMLVPGGLRPYEAIVLGPTGPRPVAERPALLLMTGLPLVWGETGPFDPQSRPAAVYRALMEEFDIRPVDYLDAPALGRGRLMLLAQPRMLEPRELVALDTWVRRGGRVLILADPDLRWPSRLPIGDPRRPPPATLLSPLLSHWGLRLAPAPAPEQGVLATYLRDGAALRRLLLVAPGRFEAAGGPCRIGAQGILASCRVGAGRALLVADADLLRDDLWVAQARRGTARHARLADNPLVVAGWLDRLAGVERSRSARTVHWRRPDASRGAALLLGAIPLLALLLAAVSIRRARGR